MTENIKINRLTDDYAWAKCVCGNTVKFDMVVLETVCAACSRQWTVFNSGDDEAVHETIEIEP